MSFNRFHEIWLDHLQQLLHQLTSSTTTIATTKDSDHQLKHLINRVMTHYDDYNRVKSHSAKTDVFAMFNSSWATSLERSLYWVAGWRPTTIFHLVYSESSHMFEARLMDLLHGRKTGDLGDLSPNQLGRVSDLQCVTVKEENAITAELGSWQESAWDLVTMSADDEMNAGRLRMILNKADDLRLRTMQKVMEVLTTQQAIEFLIATAELQFGIRGWGLEKDQSKT